MVSHEKKICDFEFLIDATFSHLGDEAKLKSLIDTGADVRNTVLEQDGRPALHLAAQRGEQTHLKNDIFFSPWELY